MVVLDQGHRVQSCNPAFESLFQYHESEIHGAELDSLLAPKDLAGDVASIHERAAAGEVVRASAQRRRRDG